MPIYTVHLLAYLVLHDIDGGTDDVEDGAQIFQPRLLALSLRERVRRGITAYVDEYTYRRGRDGKTLKK